MVFYRNLMFLHKCSCFKTGEQHLTMRSRQTVGKCHWNFVPKSSKYLLLKAFKCWVQLSQRRAHVIWRHRATSQHSRFFPIIPFLSLLDCGHKLYIEVIIYFHQANQLGIVSDEWLCSLNLSVTDTGCNHRIINLKVWLFFIEILKDQLFLEENR